MKNSRRTRVFSLLLCCLMLVGLLPLGQVAYAADSYTVTLTVGLGWGGVGFEGGPFDDTQVEKSFQAGDTVTVIAKPYGDYLFKEWTDGYGSQQPGGSTHTFTMPSRNISVLAHFREKRHYAITFEPNGGSGTMPSASVDEGDLYTLPENGFTPPHGKTFSHWGISAGGENYVGQTPGAQVDFGKLLNVPGYPTDVTLTAQWRDAVAYTVTFNANGHGMAPAEQTVYSGETATKPADPTASGWTFGGWYREAACTNAFDFSTPITGNITLYAKWDKSTFTVTFDMQGHGTAPATQYVADGGYATRPSPDPSADGWIFRGWYTEAACTNAFDFSTPITGPITLYAKWTERVNTHGIIFDNGGGTGTKDSEIGIHMATYICPPADTFGPPSADKEFDQWEVTIGLAAPQRMDPGESFYLFGDTTIKALWKDKGATAFAFTTQPASGTAKKTEGYTYSWALSDTPDTVVLQAWKPIENVWADYIGLSGASGSGTIALWSGILDGNKSTYRIVATKGSETIYSNEFTVTWTDGSSPFAFTTQPSNGSAKETEKYTYSWVLNDTPDTVVLQAWKPIENVWADYIGLSGASGSGTIELWSGILDGNKSTYRIVATKGSETIYSNEFTVTWLDDSVATYTVTFDANGHGTAPAAQTVESGKTATKPADPTEAGWTFGGWYSEAACTNAFDFATPITGNITLFAKWTEDSVTPPVPITYTVTFDANGHGTAPDLQEIENGKTATKPTDPTASGWSFGGWYKEAACTNAFDFATPITADITLYAKWTEEDDGGDEPPVPVTYTVTFDANGHGTAPASQTVESGKTATKPADPTASGWSFGGWYKEAACTNAFDFATPITGNITLFAKWTEKDDGGDEPPVVTKFTITYNLNGGTMDGKTGTVTVQVEDGATITLPKPTRSGYTFDYWEGSRYEAGASYKVTGDHTFTAQWKANTTPTNPDTGGTPGSPKTGDDSHAGLWIVLMIASLAGIGGVTFYSRKRRTSR